MNPNAPTVRSIARALGLSHTTVSDALRGVGRVDPVTAERVRAAAEAAGYRRNPLAAAVMSELRRSRGGTFRGVLAALDVHEPGRVPHGAFHTLLIEGARERGAQLGFKLEEFVVGVDGLTVIRLDQILKSRGINGVLLLPAWYPPNWTELDWPQYSAIYTDYVIERPALHSICCNHYRSFLSVLNRLALRGYRRPGLYIQRGRDERTQRRFSAAFRSYQESADGGLGIVPPLIVDEEKRDEFTAWFRKYDPDVVIAHFSEVVEWMESCGARIPETHGFASLNLLYCTQPTAGLDQQPRELGARAIELLIAQLQRNERGVPAWPTNTTVPARWVDGPTLRPAPAAAATSTPAAQTSS